MKKFAVLIALLTISFMSYCQKGYQDFDSISGVVIKTKIAKVNTKKADSPIELSLYFQNLGTRTIDVLYEIHITDGKNLRFSGKKTVNIRPNQKQFGKISNLNYELIGLDMGDYEIGAKQWHFTTLEIKDAETGESLGVSSKIADIDDLTW